MFTNYLEPDSRRARRQKLFRALRPFDNDKIFRILKDFFKAEIDELLRAINSISINVNEALEPAARRPNIKFANN